DIADMFIGNGNDLEIELWTGYFDKNGNKIYENDIIKNEPLEEIYHITRDDTYKMFKIEIFSKNFNNKIYKRKAEPDISFLKSFKSEKNMEVIGNIHENKELLRI
ncbi:YopX family protein, partial [Campylobacter coli]